MVNLREYKLFFLICVLVLALSSSAYFVSSSRSRCEEKSWKTECYYLIGVSASGQDEAYGLIQVADRSVSSAFEGVLDAEGSGANVSGLVVRLNEAVNSLVEAEVFFKNGDFSTTAEFAGRSVEVADTVKDEALLLEAEALSHRDFVYKMSLMGSGIGVPVFLFFMFFLWRRFKVYYMRRVLRMKPEVSSYVED